MPSRLSYNDSILRPTPTVTINRTFQTTSDGTKIGTLYQITINGIMLPDMGSPNSDGEFWTLGGDPPSEVVQPESRLGAILRKQQAIRDLFSEDGHPLEIQSADGSPPLKCYPRVLSNSDSEGIWFNQENYSITLEADRLFVNDDPIDDDFDDKIASADETWSIDQNEGFTTDFPPTYRITHTVTATGKRFFDEGQLTKPAWQQAKSWVQKRLGLSSIIYSGINHIPNYYGGYNHLISEQIGELNGSYSVTETWVLSSGTANEDFEISTTTTADDPISRVSIQGTITGLDQKISGIIQVSKIENAEAKWAEVSNLLLNRASQYTGLTLNPIPATSTVGKNPIQGTISYNFEYNNRPPNNFTGSISETIQVVDSNNVDMFAIIPIPFRSAGPVIQDLYTKKERTRQVSIGVVFELVSGTMQDRFVTLHPENRSPTKDEIRSLLDSLKPEGARVGEHTYDWDGISRYSKNITWVY